ncbi:MAG: M20/M25/M40 family metallo-hydrolase [Burkholderiales bacterium]|nr:M20/M25/M40 family metallo-hydrolase [Burkholderiales bacterium]
MKEELLRRIEADRDVLIDFLRRFVRCRTPNPPGDTRAAARFVEEELSSRGIAFDCIAPADDRPNYISSFATGRPGRHLVLNGHIDVFPVESLAGWTHDPWGAELVGDKIYGRGTCDMKCGTTASIFTYFYLHEMRDMLHGRLTLTLVSDEETFGPHGMLHLMAHHRERVLGDVCLNGEPSSPYSVRFGEKGPFWVRMRTKARGGHGAFVHVSPSALQAALNAIRELQDLPNRIAVSEPAELAKALDEASIDLDRAYGVGAARVIRSLTVNIGRIAGGVKVNMIPAACEFDADIRVPNGAGFSAVVAEVKAIAARHGCEMEILTASEPNWCEPYHEFMDIVRENAGRLRPGLVPARVVSPGATDARLWRLNGTPAVVYGPPPAGMGSVDEHVSLDDFLHVVRSHVVSAWDYLSKPRAAAAAIHSEGL